MEQRPEVVYTQPEALDRRKLVIRLLTVAALVVALFVGFSIFFRVDTIVISGNQKYNAWTVREVSGIDEGDSLLSFGKARACAKIAESLPYVKVVRISVKLPGTVNIYIEEVEVVYSIRDNVGSWWLMTSEGRLVEKTSAAEAGKHTAIQGVLLANPKSGAKAVALEQTTDSTGEDGDAPIVTVTNEERLQSALEIVSRLEVNGILGQTPTVDVTDMGNIQVWYGQQYQVLLGDASRMPEKIDTMKDIIDQLGKYQSGILKLEQINPDGEYHLEPFK
jgi:cell division protein FtsQ